MGQPAVMRRWRARDNGGEEAPVAYRRAPPDAEHTRVWPGVAVHLTVVAAAALVAVAAVSAWLGLDWGTLFLRLAVAAGPLAAVAFWALLVLTAPRASAPWAILRGALAGGAAALTTHFAVTLGIAFLFCVGRFGQVRDCPGPVDSFSLGVGMGLLSVIGIGPITITLGAALGAILALVLGRTVGLSRSSA
jgi:hypothetical protein